MDFDAVYIGIGNSDNKLTQADWAGFVSHVNDTVMRSGFGIIGVYYSPSNSPYQNACWCIRLTGIVPEEQKRRMQALQDRLLGLASMYQQDSISWATAQTALLTPIVDERG